MRLTPIQATTLATAVYKQLAAKIMCGELAPGQKVTLQDLADRLAVSIMPVREAIRRLEAEKYVTVTTQRRIVVNKLSLRNIEEIYKIRLNLEILAVKEAFSKLKEGTVDRLKALNLQLAKAKKPDKVMELNRRLHFTIYQQAEMPILLEIISSLWERTWAYFYKFFDSVLEGKEKWSNGRFVEIHSDLIEAVRAKDERKAVELIEMDMMEGMRYLTKLMQEEIALQRKKGMSK